MDFNFEEWAGLANTDHATFELRRSEAIEELIKSAPPARQARLRGLQFRIDMERRRCKNPLSACIKLNSMMWDSFYELQTALNDLSNNTSQKDVVTEAEPASAKVIMFRPLPG